MKPFKSVLILSVLTGLLAIVQAGVGLFYPTGGAPFPFTTLHNQVVQMNGQGIYAYDTYFKAPILRGTDAVTLFICIPLLVIALLLYHRGSLRGGLLLVGVLGFFLYISASVVLGVAYNNLFLLYVAFFSASLFAFILAFTTIDRQDLAARLSTRRLPRRGIAILMFVSGAALLAAWLGDILGALFAGTVPDIGPYTTEVTYAFDLGIITPLAVLTGILILRRAPIGYPLSALMLVVLAIVGLMVASQTVFQLQAGISLTPGQFIGKAGSFMVLAIIAVWLAARLFQEIKE
ncbi:MAG: hypothetical protein EHM21_05850 [Chloroflexi bacterium]|nr:MAG: hypothetical protein EHM21_05850 [Chloroflexota bacterium]